MPSHSTGPRTEIGKGRSSMNAVTHGLTAKTPLLPAEDSGEFCAFVWDVIAELSPQGLVQTQLAHRAAVLMWKQRRVAVAEARVMDELVEGYAARPLGHDGADDEVEEDEPAEGSQAGPAPRTHVADPEEVSSRLLADEFATAPDELDRLSRYEQRIAHQIASTIGLLMKLQNRKRGAADEPAPAPNAEPNPLASPPAEQAAPEHAPAQNELPGPEAQTPDNAVPPRWTDPPGVN